MVQATVGYLLAKVAELESQLVQEKARVLVVQSELDSAQVRMMDSELQLARWKAKE
jgi:50S ribosomal subunit-associated GTPase HflX